MSPVTLVTGDITWMMRSGRRMPFASATAFRKAAADAEEKSDACRIGRAMSRGLHRNRRALRLRGLGHCHGEHAVLERRRHLAGVDCRRQANGTVKRAVRPLDAVVALVF